jgi:hypothetical protein
VDGCAGGGARVRAPGGRGAQPLRKHNEQRRSARGSIPHDARIGRGRRGLPSDLRGGDASTGRRPTPRVPRIRLPLRGGRHRRGGDPLPRPPRRPRRHRETTATEERPWLRESRLRRLERHGHRHRRHLQAQRALPSQAAAAAPAPAAPVPASDTATLQPTAGECPVGSTPAAYANPFSPTRLLPLRPLSH